MAAGKSLDKSLKDCGYGCGMQVVWAPLASTGKPRTFNPEWCELGSGVWVLRRGRGMVPCEQLEAQTVVVLRGRGVRGWRVHTCDEYQPNMRSFGLPERIGSSWAD